MPDQAGTTTAISGMYDTLQTSQARVTFTIFRFAGRSAESETLRFRSCVEAWARTCRGVLEDTDSEGDATMGVVCGPGDDALSDAPPPAAAAAGSPPSWLLRRCTPNIFGREDATSGGQAGYPRQPWRGARGQYLRLTAATAASLRAGARANWVPKGVRASRSPFPTTSGFRQEWCSTPCDGFSSCHLCMLSWQAVCGGKANLIHFGIG